MAQGPAAAQDNLFTAAPSGQVLASDPNVLLVDIREPEEWQQTGVIAGALLVSYRDADSFLATVGPLLQDGQSIALICRSGNRTSRAARQIAAISDVPVIDIAGGMLRVLGEGYTPVTPTAAQGCTIC
ncbi:MULTISPECIES: rhodanese-like domain-containing protein [unclassified Yoonia]|uniref:rhodanese-like domain-containing protein n=1 Tax=unclassified Yoonia TaxID=2629118 RepID=UPI002AFFA98A|nr:MULTISPECIES: rhodanese-like domain-containing protein [unclassified Yoonia]